MTYSEAYSKITQTHCMEQNGCTDACLEGPGRCEYHAALLALAHQMSEPVRHIKIKEGDLIREEYQCPNCLKVLYSFMPRTQYCPDCGLRLDWSVAEDE